MEDKIIYEIAKPSDAKEIIQIYNWYILNTSVSYEIDPVSEEDFSNRIKKYSEKYPYIIAKENDKILGYAYASPFHERKAFSWDAEISFYLDKDARGKGIGSALMSKVLDILQKCNYVNIYSRINYPNEASFALHEKFGFTECGRCKRTGFKLGLWRDLVTLEKRIYEEEIPKPIDTDWKKFFKE